MLEKTDEVYAITRLTQDGLNTLLTDNINFEITDFVFIDDEVNYNLFNADQKIASGGDRVNFYEDDITSLVKSQQVFSPTHRIGEIRNYLFGNHVKHRFTPDQIKTQNDVRLDMVDSPIDLSTETTASRNTRVFDFRSQILSGNTPSYVLTDNELNTWSAAIDIRGTIVVYQGNDVTTLIEQSNAFSNLVYTIRFHGDSAIKIFEINKSVSPDEPLILSSAKLKNDLGMTYQLYGTFYIFKTFTFEGVDYTSDVIQIELKEDSAVTSKSLIFDGRAQILKNYSSSYISKDVYINIPTEENWIEPRTYGNYIADQVLNQIHVPGYASLEKDALRMSIAANNINSFHLNLQNIGTGESIPYLSVQGDAVDVSRFLTFPELAIDITLYRRLMEDGYYLMTNIGVKDKVDFLTLDSNSGQGDFEYSLFGEKRNKAHITVKKSIYLGTQTRFESLKGTELMWHFTSPDNSLLYNFKHIAPVVMTDYENLILDLSK